MSPASAKGWVQDLAKQKRYLKDVYAITEEVLRTRPSAEWLALLGEADIPAAPLHTLESLLHDPHLDDVGLFEIRSHPTEGALRTLRLPLRFFGSQPHNARPAPHLGEHTEEIRTKVTWGERSAPQSGGTQ